MSTASPDTWAECRGWPPSGRPPLREPYLETASLEQLLLVRRGAPAAVDVEPDPVGRGIGRRPAQGAEQVGVEVGHGRDLVVEDRRAVGDGAVGLAERAAALARGRDAVRRPARTTSAGDSVAERDGDRRDDEQQAGDPDLRIRIRGACSCWCV